MTAATGCGACGTEPLDGVRFCDACERYIEWAEAMT
jgi:hypothetical protein